MDAGTAIQLVIIIILIILIVIGNATMCACVAITRDLRNPSGYIVASLAVADLLVGLWLLPFSIPAVINSEWTIGRPMCLVNGYTNHVLSVASILGLFIISIDRYVTIFYPLRYTELITSQRSLTLIACSWMYAFITAICPLVGWGGYRFQRGIWLCITDFRISYSFSYFIIFTVYGIPLTIMTVIYYRIFKIAFYHSRAIQSQACVGYGSNDTTQRLNDRTLKKWMSETAQISVTPSPRFERRNDVMKNGRHLSPGENNDPTFSPNHRRRRKKFRKFKKEMKAGIVLCVIVVIFVISWTPFAILNLWALHSKKSTSLVSDAVVSRLAYFNSAINPPLYCLMNKTIRTAFRNVWFRIFKWLRIDNCFKCLKSQDSEITAFEMTIK